MANRAATTLRFTDLPTNVTIGLDGVLGNLNVNVSVNLAYWTSAWRAAAKPPA